MPFMRNVSVVFTLWAVPLTAIPVLAQEANQAAAQGPSRSVAVPFRVPVAAASDLIGRPVLDRMGERVGRVQHLLIRAGSGEVAQVLVGTERDDFLAVPWQAVDTVPDQGDRLSVLVTRGALQNAPRYNSERLTELVEPLTESRIREYYEPLLGGSREQEASAAGNREPPPEKANRSAAGAQQPEGADPHLLVSLNNVSVLAPNQPASGHPGGVTVWSPAGELIGEIDEVVIDTVRGKVAYVLLERGAFLGLGGDWLPVPISALRWSSEQNRRFVLQGGPSRLQEMPALEKGELPTSVATAQLEALYDRFGVKPYWTSTEQSAQSAGDR